jgi:hypothetical protein
MKGKGLLIAIGGKPKGMSKPEAESESDDASSPDMGGDMDMYLDQAFDALKEDDREGFKAALQGAIECCV